MFASGLKTMRGSFVFFRHHEKVSEFNNDLKDNPILQLSLEQVYRFLALFVFALDTLPFFFGMVVLFVSVVGVSK